jgi:hypothetical protein
MSKQNGGPAYPAVAENPPYHIDEGMTFRDRAAIAAMQGILSCPATFTGDYGETVNVMDYPGLAYKIADAMVAEKERRDNGDSS